MTADSFRGDKAKDGFSLIWFQTVRGSEPGGGGASGRLGGGNCQPCPQAVGSAEAALLTGRAAESRGVTLFRQSPPLEGFFSPLGSVGKDLRSECM